MNDKVQASLLSVLSAAFLGWSVLLYNGWVDIRKILLEVHQDLTKVTSEFASHESLPAHREQDIRFIQHLRESDAIMQRNSERMKQHESELNFIKERMLPK